MKKRPRKPRPRGIVAPERSINCLPPIAIVEAPMPLEIPMAEADRLAPAMGRDYPPKPKQSKIMRWLGIIFGCN